MKIRFRVCKIATCGKKYEVNPKYPLFPCCSMEHGYEYQKLLKQKKEAKELNDRIKVMKVDTHAKENKKALQDEVNKLSRIIDAYFGFGCIDCNLPLDKEKHQIDACHFISRGSNSTLKYNLHNLHSGHNHCNVYNPSHEGNYEQGLFRRYGNDYLTMVEGLPLKYKEVHLSNFEIVEKLKIVRVLIRTFGTYKFNNAIEVRNLFNTIIGIYK